MPGYFCPSAFPQSNIIMDMKYQLHATRQSTSRRQVKFRESEDVELISILRVSVCSSVVLVPLEIKEKRSIRTFKAYALFAVKAMTEVEETLKRIQSQKNVAGVIVMDSSGRAIRSTLDDEVTQQHCILLHQLCDKSKSVIRELDGSNDLTFLRLRTRKHEIMIAPDKDFLLARTFCGSFTKILPPFFSAQHAKFFDVLGLGSQEVSSRNVSRTSATDLTSSFGNNASNESNTEVQTQMQKGYSFDSSALERAADAARQLEMSRNAKEAFEIARLQEYTKQKEFEAATKQAEAQMQALRAEQIRVAEEEKRKTLIEETKHARARAEHQDQLARKRQEEELAIKARMQAESLKKQEESVRKQEAMRKGSIVMFSSSFATIEHELALKHKYDLEKVEAETHARAKAARENRDINLEQLHATEEERRKTTIEKIKTSGAVLGAGLQEFLNDPKKCSRLLIGSLTMLAVGLYGAKQGTAVVARQIESRWGKPSLVRDTSRITFSELFKHPVRTFRTAFRSLDDPLKGIILSPELETHLRDIAITTKNTKRNHGLFRNILFYGPPGTGKTLFAKSLAHHSGLDYAVMTGGDVAPLGHDGISAMHKRATEQISENMRATLNAFLYRTGEQSRKFMLIVASNQPEQFDWAVNDRLDELVEFKLPGLAERERIILQYFDKYIAAPAMSGSKRHKTDGMSGRQLSKLVIGWQAAAYASEDGVLTTEMIDRCTHEMVNQHKQKIIWLDSEQLSVRQSGHGAPKELQPKLQNEREVS
ncbi:ATPase family AAA domain-containing protein 3 [Dirofilaria immitis]|nr:ATPase family AAA domain-containing protein 3 [Dirofilaria immitis]